VVSTTIHLTDLADVIRAADVPLIELDSHVGYPDWRYRGAGGGMGYNDVGGAVVHHTASGPSWDGWRDVDYIARSGPVDPEYAIYFDRAGVAYLIASGRTNHAGRGTWPGIPTDLANRFLIGIALGNNGIGESYPAPQLSSLTKVCVALYLRYQFPIGNLIAHYEWAPTRKIDPAGPPYAKPGDPWLRWDMDEFRGSVWRLAAGYTPTPPEDDDMPAKLLKVLKPSETLDPGQDDLPWYGIFDSGERRSLTNGEPYEVDAAPVEVLPDRQYRNIALEHGHGSLLP
jgi:hypothetical protein